MLGDSKKVGIIVFGTIQSSDEEDVQHKALLEMFREPKNYKFVPFDNFWEEADKFPDVEGFFLPSYKAIKEND